MAYETLEAAGVNGIKSLLDFPNLANPFFYTFFLMVVFIVFTSLLFFKETNRERRGSLLASMAVAGFVTQGIAAVISAMGLISITNLVVVMVVILMIQVIFLLTGRDN